MTASPPKPANRSLKGAIDILQDSIRRDELVVIAGTGMSLGLTESINPALSWKGLIQSGFEFGTTKSKISESQSSAWQTQLKSEDIDDILGAAEFMSRKLDAPHGQLYARWLESAFINIVPSNTELMEAVKAVKMAGIPLCTLNYDLLLEQITKLQPICLKETSKVAAWMRREDEGILHLHGHWREPSTCVLGIRDYETTLNDETRNLVQRCLGSFKRLLFIGCGDTFLDPNFSALIEWLRKEMKAAAPQHFALVREEDLSARHADPAWRGFVDPISFGKRYADLAGFMTKVFPVRSRLKRAQKPKRTASISRHQLLLNDYCQYLLKDCGEMTIEGVKGGMDASQRRFNLERLFVPLNVLPTPPEISESDPEREEKLRKWHSENSDPRPFGDVFLNSKKIALLALPGGGKTLLLKRLAVAYADATRRQSSNDNLPNLPILPVLIRCREWREHLHLPLATLLGKLHDITGQPHLVGLRDALLPLCKNGRLLLLIDGLDEIHHDAIRATFVDRIDDFMREYPDARLIITSRLAGFSLVAPKIAGFCERWQIAPLETSAIISLCRHWHNVMGASNPTTADAEADAVSNQILHNRSIRRLAENPLLLTMLLVVKHGAGRLPPDRVSLYSRAVELLLDTWNIQGHDPLNPKEAVPQLAYVAYQMMCEGKQTITGDELLTMLEQAREKLPHVRRYASDRPHEFLRRVELRSSLLVEAGHKQSQGGLTSFYQFRHLTFQEYLAAVASVEGHYPSYQKNDTVLTPLAAFLRLEEWKEVIPMAAVLARKQAEPLVASLVQDSQALRQELTYGGSTDAWSKTFNKLPVPVTSLLQSLVEEVEAAPETLNSALQIAVFFAKGCTIEIDWTALVRGPYGKELLLQAWTLYKPLDLPRRLWILNTCASIFARAKSDSYWTSPVGVKELNSLNSSESGEHTAKVLLCFVGLLWNDRDANQWLPRLAPYKAAIERHIFSTEPKIWIPATWAWAYISHRESNGPTGSPIILNRLLDLWLSGPEQQDRTSFALTTQLGLSRDAWSPKLSEQQCELVRTALRSKDDIIEGNYPHTAAWLIAFHSGQVLPDDQLRRLLKKLDRETLRHRQFVSKKTQKAKLEQISKSLRPIANRGMIRGTR